MRIAGRVTYQSLESGFWGIIGDDGSNWLVLDMPDQLKVQGARVEVTAMPSAQESIFMWGEPIEILAFHTLPKFR
ncbi:MAG: hypothetical protein KTR24_06210 [Saprospiraceae bacterium]|nr:hypothetical protein [Saprospiraceae bacterium]